MRRGSASGQLAAALTGPVTSVDQHVRRRQPRQAFPLQRGGAEAPIDSSSSRRPALDMEDPGHGPLLPQRCHAVRYRHEDREGLIAIQFLPDLKFIRGRRWQVMAGIG
jgi:hypothetical protein